MASMLIQAAFEIDQFTIRENKNPDRLIEAYTQDHACKLGKRIETLYPFKKNYKKSYSGNLPHMALSKEHEFKDVYETEFVIITKDEHAYIMQQLENKKPDIKSIIKILSNEYLPLDSNLSDHIL